ISGSAGATVTITGTGFSVTADDNTVKFNGTAASVTSATTTSLTVTAPTGGTTGKVTVTTDGGTADGPTFTYSVPPPPPPPPPPPTPAPPGRPQLFSPLGPRRDNGHHPRLEFQNHDYGQYGQIQRGCSNGADRNGHRAHRTGARRRHHRGGDGHHE